METKADVPATPDVTNLELYGVRLDQRNELVAFVEQLFREGLSFHEVKAPLILYIRSKRWPECSQVELVGIMLSADKRRWEAKAKQAAALQVEPPRELREVSLDDVKPEPVRWLWPGKIPLGKVTVVYGAAGLGKTCWSLDLAARVSSGQMWPDTSHGPGRGKSSSSTAKMA